MFHYLSSFILLLTPLVFVHELGHFLFAKLFGVRVDVFSIGFGPKIFRRKRGETEYCISAIPLGGYVKLLGQDPTEQVDAEWRHRSFVTKEPWKRFLILFGGPLFNFLFAVIIFSVILLHGEPHVSARIGRILPGSQADVAGFRSGDMITAVDDKVVTKFEDVQGLVSESAGKTLRVRVRRNNAHQDLQVTPQPAEGMSIYGEPLVVGEIGGLQNFSRFPVVAVTDKRTAAAVAGVKTGDVITAVDGVAIGSYEDLEEIVKTRLSGGAREFTLEYAPRSVSDWTPASDAATDLSKVERKKITLSAAPLSQLGIHSSELIVSGLLSGSPAEKAGIKAGDYLLTVNNKPLTSFFMLREEVQASGESKGEARLVVMREGRNIAFPVKPAVTESRDLIGREVKAFAVGIYPLMVASEPDMIVERIYNPLVLAGASWARAFDLSAKTLISIKKLFSRQVSMGTLGGPLLIGKLAGDSISRGIVSFLKVMALISISLAVFNILPVPVLDGGHIVLLLVEVLRGKPLGLKQTEWVQQVGLSLIMLLLVVVLFNDFSRVAVPAFQNVFR